MKLATSVGIGSIALVAGLATFSVAMSRDGAAPAAAAPAPIVAAEGAFTVDAVHSAVVYRIKHMDVSYFYGRFNKVEGTFAVDPADASKNSVEISIPTDSIDSNNAGRDKHLKNQDFFSATEFPTITFKSTSWKPTTKENGEQGYEVTGDLTLLGKTKSITVPIRHVGTGKGRSGEVAGIEATFTIKRSDFGMNFMVGKGLGDEVTIMAGLEGGRK